MIPDSRQNIDDKDIEEVIKILKSDYLTTGPKIDEFERKFADYVGSKYAIAVSNGTAALHLACLAAGLKSGDEILTSPLTFAADGNCALYCQAKPQFVDITPQGLLDPEKLSAKISNKTKIIIPVDYAGFACNLEKIKEIADDHKIAIIEDCSHALGAKYKNEILGNGKYSDMAIFSFHPVKHITTGEGGMITTNSQEFYKKLTMLRTHGITKEHNQIEKDEGPWYYEMQLLGFNYRLTDIQCALGISQLNKIDEFIRRRREIAKKYDYEFSNSIEFTTIAESKDQYSTYHLYPILCKEKKKRRKIFEYLRKQQIWVQVHYIPVYFHPYYEHIGYSRGICPNAENFYEREISIPVYSSMTDQDINKVIQVLAKAFRNT